MAWASRGSNKPRDGAKRVKAGFLDDDDTAKRAASTRGGVDWGGSDAVPPV